MLKILIVIGQMDRGGTEKHLANVLPLLLGRELHIQVFAFRTDGALIPEMEQKGVKVIGPGWQPGGWVGIFATALALCRTLWRDRPDVVHFFLPEAYMLGGLCGLVGPRSIRLMSRRSLNRYQQRWPMSRALELFLHRHVDGVLVNSQAVRNEVLAERLPEEKIGLIYNGVAVPPAPVADTSSRLRERLQIQPGVVVFVMVANLISYKGHQDLLDALSIARKHFNTDWRVLLIGSDVGIGAALKQKATQLHLDDKLVWLGGVASVTPYLQAADIGVLCSHEEGFSNAILEYMAAGLPVVATDVGGNAEAVLDGECGRVVPSRQPGSLAAALVDLTNDAGLRSRLGAAGRRRVGKLFSIDACADGYRRVYTSFCNKDRRPVSAAASADA